jgi:hypothetical protein
MGNDLPVLKMGYFPSFVPQNDSRWYKPHWGVVRDLIFGLLGSDMLVLRILRFGKKYDYIEGKGLWWWGREILGV